MKARSAGGGWLSWLSCVGGMILSLLVNYHSYLTDFNLVPGDRGDTRLVIFTLEHWFNVFRGREAFFVLQMFHPDKLALAYADGLLLFGLPYSAYRALGLDYFTSYQLVLAFTTALGYWAWMLLFRRALKLRLGFAVLGAVLLTSLNSLQFQSDIGKLTAIHLFPLEIWLLYLFAEAEPGANWKGTLSLCGAAAGLGLLFFTSYYPAWFLLFSLAMLGAVGLAAGILLAGPRNTLGKALRFLRDRRWQVLAALVIFGMSLTPFFITYAPLIRSSSTRSFSLVLEFAPRLGDLFNVSERNYIWSPVLRRLGFDFGNREMQMGSPILLMLLFIGTAAWMILRSHGRAWPALPVRERLLMLLSLTALVLIIISARIDGWSLWYVVYKFVPGASALRALGRILMIVDMILIVVAVCGLDEVYRRLAARPGRGGSYLMAGVTALGAFLIAEQVNATPFRLDKAQQLSFMGQFHAPSADCEAFFINNASPEDWPVGYYQLDAMMIGMRLGIPAVNGYSGFEPHRAFTLVPQGVEYKYEVLNWLQEQGATSGICELDYQSGALVPTDVIGERQRYRELYLASFLQTFTALYEAASKFLIDGNALSNLYPQYLEEHGYLDAGLGHETGLRYRWMRGRYWIGEQPCDQGPCIGIRVVGSYAEVQQILDTYSTVARRVFYPDPQEWQAGKLIPENAADELLMIFSAEATTQ